MFGVDLGADKVNVLNLDLVTGAVTRTSCRSRRSPRARGRGTWRSIPIGMHAYVLDELTSNINVVRLRLRCAARSSGCRRSRRCRATSTEQTRLPRSAFIRAGRSSTTPIAATTASPMFEITRARKARVARMGVDKRRMAARHEHRTVGHVPLRSEPEHRLHRGVPDQVERQAQSDHTGADADARRHGVWSARLGPDRHPTARGRRDDDRGCAPSRGSKTVGESSRWRHVAALAYT